MGPYRHILVPIDFSEPSKRALDAAVDLAVAFGAKLSITHTLEIPGYAYAGMGYPTVDFITPLQETAKELLSTTLEAVRKRLPDATSELRTGGAWEQTLAVAKDVGADLIVIGTHGRSGIAHAFLGSVAEKVVQHAHCPVLTVPQRRAAL